MVLILLRAWDTFSLRTLWFRLSIVRIVVCVSDIFEVGRCFGVCHKRCSLTLEVENRTGQAKGHSLRVKICHEQWDWI